MGRLALLLAVSGSLACRCERPRWLKAVRPPVFAGTWYERDKARLETDLRVLLSRAPLRLDEPANAMVAPHAALTYSGVVAAAAFGAVSKQRYDRVVILADSHHAAFRGAALPDAEAFGTPLGALKVDQPAVDLLAKFPGFATRPVGFDDEHGIELQLPWVKLLWPEARIVPVVFDRLEEADLDSAVRAIRNVLGGRTLLIASSDLGHVGPDFRIVPDWWIRRPRDRREMLAAADRLTLDLIARSRAQELDAQIEYPGVVCGRTALSMLARLGLEQGEVLVHRTSATAEEAEAADARRLVGYGAVVFRGRFPEAPLLSDQDRQSLLLLARTAARAARAEAPPPRLPAPLSPRLASPGSAFVTLRQDGSTRGCNGYVDDIWPLARVVIQSATDASSADSRRPLRPEEIDEMATGTVKVWSPARGSGWIKSDGGGDLVYVHKSGIVREVEGRAPRLERGQRVEFQIGQRPKGSAAINVRPLASAAEE